MSEQDFRPDSDEPEDLTPPPVEEQEDHDEDEWLERAWKAPRGV